MKSIIISSVLSLILTGNPVMFSNPPGNLIPTPYGTATKEFSYGTELDPVQTIVGTVQFPVVGYVSSMTYTFTRPATGNFTLTTFNELTNYQMFVEGGYLVSVTTDGFIFRVNHSSEFKCTIIVNNTAHPSWNYQQFLALTNQTIEFSDTEIQIEEDILTSVTSIDGNVQTIQANTQTIKNVILQSLGGYVTNDGSLYTDMQTLIDTLQEINNQKITYDVPEYQISIMRMLTQNDPSKIEFNTFGKFVTYIDSIVLTNYMRVNEKYVMIYASGTTNIYPVFQENDVTSSVIRTIRSYNNVFYIVEMYTSSSGTKHFTFNNSTVNRYIYPYYYGWAEYIPQELMSIASDKYSDAYTKKIDEAINAIRSMAINVNNLTVNATGITYNTNQTQVDNSVTSYQNNIQIVNSVENNFKDMFDTANQNYNVDNIPITNQIVATSTFMNNITTDLFALDIIKYPVGLLLLGIVIIGLLG